MNTVSREAITSVAKVDFDKRHVPFLFIEGDTDHIMSAHLTLRHFRACEDSGLSLDYQLFPGRNHFVLGFPTWQEDADYSLN